MNKMKKFIGLLMIGLLSIGLLAGCGSGSAKETTTSGSSDPYALENVQPLENSPLEGKTFIFLGSSVTFGKASRGIAFPEYIQARNNCTCVKEAQSGTTLVDDGDISYISRMKNLDTSLKADAFICQLSTNDATHELEVGSISDSKNPEDFDTQTVIGGMEYIIAYAQQTWNCPVVFFTNPYFENENYGKMVEALNQLKEKWGIEVLDLYNDAEFNQATTENFDTYMSDEIHPTAAGYYELWTPKFEEFLKGIAG